jgi:hypothetical protein
MGTMFGTFGKPFYQSDNCIIFTVGCLPALQWKKNRTMVVMVFDKTIQFCVSTLSKCLLLE